jgi:hypothetical protein
LSSGISKLSYELASTSLVGVNLTFMVQLGCPMVAQVDTLLIDVEARFTASNIIGLPTVVISVFDVPDLASSRETSTVIDKAT